MKKIASFTKRNWFRIAVFAILLLATFLRFYNYENRWGLAYDQAHDALVARYAIENHKIPLVGPFSSAGPFQTGGEWYWIIMAAYAVSPNSILSPWILITLFYIAHVFIIILLGTELFGKRFGIVVGILSAVSTAQIAQSVNLTNQSPLALVSLLALCSMVAYLKKREAKYIFLLGFFVSIALTIHLQGISLVFLIVGTLLVVRPRNVTTFLSLFLGMTLPLVPLLVFDLQNDFVNSKGFFQYILHDQYKVSLDVLGRRWLTYAGVFWPNSWAHIIGGVKALGYVQIILLGLAILYSCYKRTMTKVWLIIIASLFFIVILLRYTRTPLFDSYLTFLHPFVLLLSGWLIFFLGKRQAILGIAFFLVILIGTFSRDLGELKGGENYSALEASERVKALMAKFPNESFSVYTYKYKWIDKNAALTLFLDVDNKINDNGRKISVVIATVSGEFRYPIIQGGQTGYQLLDLQSSTSAQLSQGGWGFINPSEIYRTTQEWHKK